MAVAYTINNNTELPMFIGLHRTTDNEVEIVSFAAIVRAFQRRNDVIDVLFIDGSSVSYRGFISDLLRHMAVVNEDRS